jgi:hypothetical protein
MRSAFASNHEPRTKSSLEKLATAVLQGEATLALKEALQGAIQSVRSRKTKNHC